MTSKTLSMSSHLKLVTEGPEDRRRKNLFVIHSLRTALLVVVLLMTLSFQIFQKQFINFDVWLPVYFVLLLGFTFNSLFLVAFTFLEKKVWATATLLSLDAVLVTGLLNYTGVNQSLFVFLYFVTILLTGLVYGRKGAILMALWVGGLYAWLLALNPFVGGEGIYFSLGLNMVAFFAVAGLSGTFSEQIDFMGMRLEESSKKIQILSNLNDLIVRNIPSGMITVNRDGDVEFANPQAEEILKESEIKGRPLSNVLPEVYQILNQSEFNPEQRSVRHEVSWQVEGQMRLIEVVASPLLNDEGADQGYLLILQDLTDLKKMERQLRQKEKLAAVGQLAAGIAHEIRNPLASISGSIQLMAGSPDVDPEKVRLMNIVLREIDRLNNLITEFLEYVRPEEVKKEAIDLNALVKEILEQIRFNKNLRQDIQQKVELESKNWITGNRDKLKQALLNIILNSYQAMEMVEDAEISVSSFDDKGKVVLKISDTGVGISSETLDRIFEPFHTTKPKGTGLGLAVTHKILEAHDAVIGVESQPNIGTTFRVEFPGEFMGHPNEQKAQMRA